MVLKTAEHKSIKELAELQVKVKKNPLLRKLYPTRVTSSKDAYQILWEIVDKEFLDIQETMIAMYFNRNNQLTGYKVISNGGIAGTVCDPKHVYAFALGCMASGIIMAHNHPSGNLMPSDADINLTRKLKNGGIQLDIVVMDHLIFTSEKGVYYSFGDEGRL